MVPDFARAILVSEEPGEGDRKAGGRGKRRSGKPKAGAASEQESAKAFASVRDAAAEFVQQTGHEVTCRRRGKAIELTARGVSAHGAHPEDGRNAISILMALLAALPLAEDGAREFIEFYHRHIGFETDGGSLGIAMEDALSGRLIVNAGMLTLGRDAAILTLNVRVPVSRSEEDVFDALRPLIDRHGMGVVRVSGMAPLYFDQAHPLVAVLMQAYRDETGDDVTEPLIIGGGTYARAIPSAVAFGPMFPGEADVMHQRDESVDLDNLMRAARIYANAIARLAGKGSPMLLPPANDHEATAV